MNNTNTTEELLKTIDLTLDDVKRIIKEGVNGRYRSFKVLQETTTKDDLEQDVLLYYFSIMKSTGDIRLNHYIKKYQDKEHIINLIKQTSYRLPMNFIKSNEVVHRPVASIYEKLSIKNSSDTTFEDMIVDENAEKSIGDRLLEIDLIEIFTTKLKEFNLSYLKNRYDKIKSKNKHYNENNLPLLLDIQHYVNIYNEANDKTLTQLLIINDLCMGYTKRDLTEKYETFTEDMRIIKLVLKKELNKYFATSC